MGKLRHRLLKSLFCATAFLACAFAQTVLTPIRDTVTNTDGSLFNGTVAITWNGAPPPSGTVSGVVATARIYNGALSLLLVPNTNGSTYQAVYTSSDGTTTWNETWQVPASTTPLTLSQVRVSSAGSSGSGSGSGSGGGNNYATLPISISEVTDLSSDLNTIDTSLAGLTSTVNGLSSTVTSLSNSVSANGTSISSLNGSVNTLNTQVTNLNNSVSALTSTVNSLSSGGSSSTVFVDAEKPSGTQNGTNATFVLANTPSPATSLEVYRNGVLQAAGVDYTLSVNSITFLGTAIPQANDVVQAFYRTPGSGTAASFVDAEVPSGIMNGVNVGFTLANAPNPAMSLRLYKNGILLQQNYDYTLTGSSIVFANTSIAPQPGDTLTAYYRH
jgi:hypothetical protein